MRFSLVMPTLGRKDEVLLFLQSLAVQTFRDFELIVVDQNEGNDLQAMVAGFGSNFPIIYIHSDRKGLSYNRNLGIGRASGSIIAFPDDDCIYPPDTLSFVDAFFKGSVHQILTLNTKDQEGEGAVVNLSKTSTDITKSNFLNTGCSITIFTCHRQRSDLHFDEQLGVGARYGSSEESEFLLSLLHKGYKGYYVADQYVYHPAKVGMLNAAKGYNYGTGMGAMFKKHIVHYRNYALIPLYLKLLIKSIGGIILTNKRAFYYQTLKGRIAGFLDYKPA